MQIAVVDTTLMRPPWGGCQTFLVNLTRSVSALGVEVHVVTAPGPANAIARRIESLGGTVHLDLWPSRSLPEDRAEFLATWVATRGIAVYILSVSADVGWLTLPLLPARVATIAVVQADSRSFYDPLRHYAAFVDRAVGVSAETRRRIVASCGLPEARATRIPYGVERLSRGEAEARWGDPPPSGPLRVGYVGRLEHDQKRVLDLPVVADELARRAVSLRLDVVGDGADREGLKRRLETAGLKESVRFWGWLPPDEVGRRLRELDVLVLFSDFEGLPAALLEAMGHAVVPVVTDIASGHRDVVRSGTNGFLVDVGDIGGFVAAIERLDRDRGLLQRMRRAAWEGTQELSSEAMAEAYLSIIEQIRSEPETARAPRPPGPFPLMPSCRSRYPRWLRRLRWRIATG